MQKSTCHQYRTIEDHDTLFVLAEIAHFVGIGLLGFKMYSKRSAAGEACICAQAVLFSEAAACCFIIKGPSRQQQQQQLPTACTSPDSLLALTESQHQTCLFCPQPFVMWWQACQHSSVPPCLTCPIVPVWLVRVPAPLLLLLVACRPVPAESDPDPVVPRHQAVLQVRVCVRHNATKAYQGMLCSREPWDTPSQ